MVPEKDGIAIATKDGKPMPLVSVHQTHGSFGGGPDKDVDTVSRETLVGPVYHTGMPSDEEINRMIQEAIDNPDTDDMRKARLLVMASGFCPDCENTLDGCDCLNPAQT